MDDDKVFITPDSLVTVTKMNHIIEVQHLERMNRKAHIKKLDKDRFVDLKTGEIREFEHSQNRQQNYNSLRQTFKKIRYLINNNFQGHANELHVTLTYKENMMDTKQLYGDFKRFMTRLKRKYQSQTTIDYMTVVEPQERGAWHCHLLVRFNDVDKIYIPSQTMADLWGMGFVKIKALKDIDNIGAYLSAYLADVELSEEHVGTLINEKREIVTKQVDGQEKKFIKGGRLHMYPPGMNLYRKSKGIVEPERENMRYKDVKKIVGSANPHYQRAYHIENKDFQNTISFIQYNTKRKDGERQKGADTEG